MTELLQSGNAVPELNVALVSELTMPTAQLDDHLNDVMVAFFRSLTGAQRLAVSDRITTNTRAEMRRQL